MLLGPTDKLGVPVSVQWMLKMIYKNDANQLSRSRDGSRENEADFACPAVLVVLKEFELNVNLGFR